MKKYIEETLSLIAYDLDSTEETLKHLLSIIEYHKKDLGDKMADDSIDLFDLTRKSKMFKLNARKLNKMVELFLSCSDALDLVIKNEEKEV